MAYKNFLAATAAIVTVVACEPAAAAVTYNVSQTIGSGSVSGTITTDGATGALTTADITDFSLTLNDGSTLAINPSNAQVLVGGTALTATPTGLFFDFSGTGSQYALFQHPHIGSGATFFCAQTSGCFDWAGAGLAVDVSSPFPGQITRLSGIVQIGSAAVGGVPEPSTWATMLLGFGAIGFAMRRRKAAIAQAALA